jgi:hypothetical protein
MIGVVASRFDETSKSPECKTFSAPRQSAAGVSPLNMADWTWIAVKLSVLDTCSLQLRA